MITGGGVSPGSFRGEQFKCRTVTLGCRTLLDYTRLEWIQEEMTSTHIEAFPTLGFLHIIQVIGP